MKYAIALFAIMVPTIIVGLSVFHLLILPLVTPFGFLSMMVVTAVFGYMFGVIAEHFIHRLHDYLEIKFP